MSARMTKKTAPRIKKLLIGNVGGWAMWKRGYSDKKVIIKKPTEIDDIQFDLFQC